MSDIDPAEAPTPSSDADSDAQLPPMPAPTLQTHVFHLASQVAMSLGHVDNPITGKKELDLRAARFLVDTLAMLEQKTRGNRTDEEDTYVTGVLADLRMKVVSASS